MNQNDVAGKKKTDLRAQILDIIAREGSIDREKITGEATLDDLGVQSIDVVIILNAIEDELKIYVPIDQTMNDVRTVDQLINAIARLSEAPASEPPST
jgi:acyl carrier protein